MRTTLLAVVVTTLAATSAFAGGFNLSWSRCDTSPASGDRTYACDGQLGTSFFLQGTFRIDHDIPDFIGCSSVVDFKFASSVPDYWSVTSGHCDYAALSLTNPRTSTPCASDPFDPNYSGGGFSTTNEFGRLRCRIDWATGPPTPISAGALYPAFQLEFDPDQGVRNGCAGCAIPGCIIFQSVEAFGNSQGEDYFLYERPDVRMFVTWQGGAIGGSGCPAATPTRRATWGEVKSLYR